MSDITICSTIKKKIIIKFENFQQIVYSQSHVILFAIPNAKCVNQPSHQLLLKISTLLSQIISNLDTINIKNTSVHQ